MAATRQSDSLIICSSQSVSYTSHSLISYQTAFCFSLVDGRGTDLEKRPYVKYTNWENIHISQAFPHTFTNHEHTACGPKAFEVIILLCLWQINWLIDCCRSVTQYVSTARDPQPISLTVTWNSNFLVEGAASVVGEYLLELLIRLALTWFLGLELFS